MPGPPGMARIRGGAFWMGSDRHYEEEAPARQVVVCDFLMDIHPVTNRQFHAFVHDTGYVTLAERPLDPARYPGVDPAQLQPGALVFAPPEWAVHVGQWQQWWTYQPGAHWARPEAREAVLSDRLDHPVTCVAYEDAEAYARWAGKSLPTEAQWEYAARGGLPGADYAWGDEFMPGGRRMANTWVGEFPKQQDPSGSGYRTTPVGSFPANGYGLYDMIGNVWEWTRDWYTRDRTAASSCCGGPPPDSYDPALPAVRIPRRVVKGGSFLCAANYCARYRPAARQPQMIDTASVHIGFRCVDEIKSQGVEKCTDATY